MNLLFSLNIQIRTRRLMRCGIVWLFLILSLLCRLPAKAVDQTDILAPNGSSRFGTSVTVLPNGNFVVTDPSYDLDKDSIDVGAVYLYNGATHSLISTLTGNTSGDQVASGSVILLSNGNYVVSSPHWHSRGSTDAGAVTWGNGTNGVSGVVSSSNSLVGTKSNDQIGSNGVIALNNGNYVVVSPKWDNGNATDAGAVTWGEGKHGVTGKVSSGNSLVGSTNDDQVGNGSVIALSNGNYVVISFYWDNGNVTDAGAVTWGNGVSGMNGIVSSSNSLVGSQSYDRIGNSGVTALTNGNYVVSSYAWANGNVPGAGAVTWGNGMIGLTGEINSSNSLVGNKNFDSVGNFGVTPLTNGNFVVRSPYWNNGGATYVGAVTWGNGASGSHGVVSSTNSLVGSTTDDQVGFSLLTVLNNGNYVVRSPFWDNGSAIDAGAVTWANGTTGVSGIVSSSNSLVGSRTDDRVGSFGVTALSNGNYVVISSFWDNGNMIDVGAVTRGNGTSGVQGEVSSSNSFIGGTTGDALGFGGVTALNNGNYVVASPHWNNSDEKAVGAVTWLNGTSQVSGMVSVSTSLVGSTVSDTVGSGGVTALTNGNYVVNSPSWHNGSTMYAGATTWGSGISGIQGIVSSNNSHIGNKNFDAVGNGGVTALNNGNYIVASPGWDNGSLIDAGAVTWGNGTSGSHGIINDCNSVQGITPNGGAAMVFDYDGMNQQFVVGRPADNLVTLFRACAPEIDVLGKGSSIADGDGIPGPNDGADFGTAAVESVAIVHNFTISNTGDDQLTVTAITLSGPGSTHFSISSQPITSVAVNSSNSFALTFTPHSTGTLTATVTITNNDADENPYSFGIKGVGVSQFSTIYLPIVRR